MNINYTIQEANLKHRKTIFAHHLEKWKENSLVWVAVNNNYEIIGRIIIEVKQSPQPLDGKSWFIVDLLVNREYRRHGIATTLVNTVKDIATQRGILYLHGSANPTTEASFFWFSQGFSMTKYGPKQNNESEPLKVGNYNHMFCFRIERKECNRQNDYNIVKANAEQSETIFKRCISTDEINNAMKEYYQINKDNFSAFVALDNSGGVIGFAQIIPDEMYAPFNSIQWWIRNIYVNPEYRRKGIGTTLVNEVINHAKQESVVQLSYIKRDESEALFWNKIGFDVFFWDANKITGHRSFTAMLRI